MGLLTQWTDFLSLSLVKHKKSIDPTPLLKAFFFVLQNHYMLFWKICIELHGT